jgi:hypothetical protein
MILTQAFSKSGILLLDTDTLTLACWKDATPHSLFIQSEEPPAPETMKAFHQALVGYQYQGAAPLFVTSAQPVTPEETIVLFGENFIAAHHLPSSFTLLYGGDSDLPPLIRKSRIARHHSQIPDLTFDLVHAMNASIGRTSDGIPVAPFMVAPRLIG